MVLSMTSKEKVIRTITYHEDVVLSTIVARSLPLRVRSVASSRLFSASSALLSEAQTVPSQEMQQPQLIRQLPSETSTSSAVSAPEDRYTLRLQLPCRIPAKEFSELLKPYRGLEHVEFSRKAGHYEKPIASLWFTSEERMHSAAEKMQREPLLFNGHKLEASVIQAPLRSVSLGFELRPDVDPQELEVTFKKMETLDRIRIKQHHVFKEAEWICDNPDITVYLKDAKKTPRALELIKPIARAGIWTRVGRAYDYILPDAPKLGTRDDTTPSQSL